MADVSKTNGIPVVSTASPPPHDRHPPSPACKLTSSSSNRDSPNTTSSTGSDLSYGLVDADDGASLQDLIDSELALRISTDTIGPDPDPDSPPPPPIVTRVELLDLEVAADDDGSVGSERPECRRGDSADSDSAKVDAVSTSNGDGSDSPVEIVELVEAGLDSDRAESNGGGDSPVVETSPDSDRPGSDAAGGFPPDSGQPPSPPTDVNSAFIAAEQNHQQPQLADVTEADILFYNTFNQAQSNGDDGFLSSPDAFVEHKFNPFATIPSQDVESPVFEAAEPPFPPAGTNACVAADASAVVVTPNRDSSSCVVGVVDNRMSEELTRQSSGDVLTPRSTVSTQQPHLLDIVIPEIGVTPPEPGTEYDEDEYYRNLEASREGPEVVQQEPEVIEYDPVIISEITEVILYEPEVIQYDPEVIQNEPEVIEYEPEVIEYDPEVIENDPEVIEYDPEVIQCDPEIIQSDPEIVQSDPEIQYDPEVILYDPESTRHAPEALRDDLEVSLSESEPVNGEDAKEDFDSWTKVSEVDFDRSDETAVVAEEDSVEVSQSSTEEVVGDTSQASEPVEHDLCFNSRGSDSESSEALSSGTEKKSTKKKKSEVSETITNTTTKTKRNKKTKKEEKENISVKSSFSKFDALSKKTVLHVRSGDASKAQKQFSQASSGEVSSNCKACGKQVFQMEQVKAERCVWHKNCFRCKECNKQLTVDIYSSHEGVLYCKPHFKDLFKPKAVIEDDTPVPRRRKAGPIISENQPTELPPDIVRGSDKPDLGLEELSSLNVKSRFQAFEQKNEEENNLDRSLSAVNVKRSPSILSKLAKFQSKGMDVGVTDDSLNGVPLQDSSSSEEEEEEVEGEREVVRANRKHRERPVSFSKMEDIKGRWETGTALTREERREERKQEISTIRSRLFMGHQGKMKEAYQQAVSESTAATLAPGKKDSIEVGSDRARSIKERFERGDVANTDAADDEQKRMIDEDLVDAGYTKKSRSLFLEMDATAAKCAAPTSPAPKPGAAIVRDESFRRPREAVKHQTSEDVVRCSDAVEDVQVETADVGNKFKFFETFKPTERERRAFRITPPREGQVKGKSPEREIYRDPTIVRADDRPEEQEVMRSQTASKMLSFFKHMEESATKEELPIGPKPLKRFTPPPDCEIGRDSGSSEEESASESEEEDEEHNPDIIRSSDKVEDEFLKQSQSAAAVHAKALRAKFERWEEKEAERERAEADHLSPHSDPDRSDTSSIDTTRSLRARFESMNGDQAAVRDKAARPKVNRFVEIQTSCAEFCATCEKKVYQLERVETGGKIFHKNCFRCVHCKCILRMDSYTLNGGRLYCIPHFKQIFFAKGNYEEGFGVDQHKRKWASSKSCDIMLALTPAEH